MSEETNTAGNEAGTERGEVSGGIRIIPPSESKAFVADDSAPKFAPDQFGTAITEAERDVFQYLCSTLGFASGKNGFLALNPGIPDCFVFDIGTLQHPETVCFQSQTYHFRAMAEIYNRERACLQGLMMELLRVLPAGGNFRLPEEMKGGNVSLFRLAGDTLPFERIAPAEVTFNERTIPTFLLPVYFDLVFSVGNRPTE